MSQENANEALELSILDSYAGDAIAMARRANDIAIRKISLGEGLKGLTDFCSRLDTSMRGMGTAKKPSSQEIADFGKALFEFAIGDDLERLYNRLPATHVTLKILTNHSALRKIPWEYWQEPGQPLPRNGRCVVRVIPTIGKEVPAPLPKSSLHRVLLVAADPVGLRGVDWDDIRETIERVYNSRLARYQLDLQVIEGTDRDTLTQELSARRFDIVHFSCHGDVHNGMGRLVLVNRKTSGPDYITARELGMVLAGLDIRLVILSACDSSVPGAESDDFANTAEALIEQGIPAVIANQAPIPNSSIAIFAGAVYGELLESGDIDKAVTKGRIALSMGTYGGPEWGITTLHRLHGAAQLYL